MENQENYRELFELAEDMMLILDQTRRVIVVNQAVIKRLGYTMDEMLGRPIDDFVVSNFAAMLDGRYEQAEHAGFLVYESAMIRKDGSVIDVEVCNRPITWLGEPAYYGVVRDISERKRAESRIRESERKWRELFDNMTTGFALHDVICDQHGKVIDYRFLEVNRAYEQLTGLKGEDIIGRTVLEVLPGTEDYWIDIFGRVAVTGEPAEYENYSKELGRWYQVRAYSPKQGQFAVIVSEITDRVLIEKSLESSERDLRHAQSIAHVGSWTHDMQGKITWSDECYRIFGYSPESFTPNREELYKLVHPEDVNAMAEWNKVCMSGQDPGPLEWRCVRPDGSVRYILGHGELVRDADGQPSHMAGTVQDVTERRQVEAELRIAATAFESQQCLMITDANTVILRVNKAFCESTGYTSKDIVGLTPRILKSGRHDREFYREMWNSIENTGYWEGEIWDRHKNGEVYPKWLSISAVRGDGGRITHYVGSHIDISERKLAEEKIQHLAFYDYLTDLPNRLLLMDRLHQACVSSLRNEHVNALLLIDMDNFKNLNDTLGHDVGDLLLKQVTQRLLAHVRVGDTVARQGGDEFVVMLTDLHKDKIGAAEQTEIIGQNILRVLSEPYELGKYTYHCTASMGVSLFSGDAQSEDELLKQADIALYQAKRAGRNSLHFFDPQMQINIDARVSLEAELHTAIEHGQFQLYYQIQVDENTRPFGAEALIRWNHPRRGIVLPGEFISLAEETGMILPIGLWVLESACKRLARWQQDPAKCELSLAVNVSARQFHQPEFVVQVREIVGRNAVNPHYLKLELTEGILLEKKEETIAIMKELQQLGIQIALDDFGTGYSSLSYLKRLALYQLKIDQSFVRDIVVDPNDRTIVRTIVAMAQSLDLNVIAEGVETEEQWQFLRNSHCNRFQGYLFGRPMPADELEELLKD